MKKHLPDILFIVVAAAVLIWIVETDREEFFTRFPFLWVFIPYVIGRQVGRR